MKKLWNGLGAAIFIVCRPLFIIYFKFSSERSRVVLVFEGEVLLVQGWLSRQFYSLPGGGAKQSESAAAAAARELKEETGIDVLESSLKRIGLFHYNERGIRYNAQLFSVELSQKPALKLRKPEISHAAWLPLKEALQLPLDQDAEYALKHYRPVEQRRLL